MARSRPRRSATRRPICLVHPGRAVVCACQSCYRNLCRACLYERSAFCSKYCFHEFMRQQNESATGRSLTRLVVAALIAAALCGIIFTLLEWLP